MISNEFKQNVALGDPETVRSALVDYLISDRTFKKFDEALNYASTSLDIIQPHDHKPFETEVEKWDKSYLNRQKVALKINFSKERIVHIKKVIQKVMPVNDEQELEITSSRPIMVKTSGNRTGKTILSEKELVPKMTSNEERKKIKTEAYGNRTGRTILSEKELVSERPHEGYIEKKYKSEDDSIGTAMLVGGGAVTAVGLVIAEPIVVCTGVALVGVGAGVKVKSRR